MKKDIEIYLSPKTRWMLLIAVCLLLIIAFTSCTKPPAPEPSFEIRPVIGLWPEQSWTDILVGKIDQYGQNLLSVEPIDSAPWCLGQNKIEYWVKLISAISQQESSWNPKAIYVESFKDSHGLDIVSTGLMQVSAESCMGYGMKNLTTEKLKDPAVNLECAVRILDRWVSIDKVIGSEKLGAAQYWAVMRPTSKRELIRQSMCKI